jgi:putative transposase
VSRFAYNWALATWKTEYEAGNKPTAFKLSAIWNLIRREQFPWSYEVTKCASQQAIIDVGKAFSNYFRDLKKTGHKSNYPAFKKKGKSRDSFYITNSSNSCPSVKKG